jgi:hypothetical protein
MNRKQLFEAHYKVGANELVDAACKRLSGLKEQYGIPDDIYSKSLTKLN